MNDQVSRLEQKVLKIEGELRKKQNTESKLLEYAADATKFLDVIQGLEKRMEYLSARLQGYIHRECVLTEVSRYVRGLGSTEVLAHFHLKLMKAYNWDDEFWEQRGSGNFTIQQWLEKIMAVEDPVPVSASEEIVV